MIKFVIEIEVDLQDTPTPDVTAVINAFVTLPSGEKVHGQNFAERSAEEPYTSDDVVGAIQDAFETGRAMGVM